MVVFIVLRESNLIISILLTKKRQTNILGKSLKSVNLIPVNYYINPMSNNFYSDDVNAQATAENAQDPSDLLIKDEVPVTSGEMEIGDMDAESEVNDDSGESVDEESMPGSDNV